MPSESYATSCLTFLEAAYSWELDDDAWLRGLLMAAVGVWGSPRWACAYQYDASDINHFQFSDPVLWSGAPLVKTMLMEGLARISPPAVHAHRTLSFGFGKPIDAIDEITASEFDRLETVDYFGLNGLDGSGLGCFIGIGAERTTLSEKELLAFQRLAAHLASAYRCRRRLRGGQDAVESAEAVLHPDGRCLEARGLAEARAARTALQDAVRSIESVRVKTSADAPMKKWRPRINARWTLVDVYSRGGERFIVARENQTNSTGLETLTNREQQVVVGAAMGSSNKEIAYDLGISHATARVLLSRAYARLGVKSRKEFFELQSVRALRGEQRLDRSSGAK